MDNLKGKAILIGKEPERGRLLISIAGTTKMGALGADGCVPACVSRCLPASGVAHARIDIDDAGHLKITNLKSQNVTYVDGTAVITKIVRPDSVVELGMDRYRIDLAAVLKVAEKLLAVKVGGKVQGGKSQPGVQSGNQTPGVKPQPPKLKYTINHLEGVWLEQLARRKEVRDKQKKVNLIRTGCGAFSMLTVPCSFVLGPVAYVFTGIGLLGTVYSFVGLKNDDAAQKMEEITEEFQDKYVCPNPDCNKFLGNMSYKLLKKQYSMHCPYCKCEYVEK